MDIHILYEKTSPFTQNRKKVVGHHHEKHRMSAEKVENKIIIQNTVQYLHCTRHKITLPLAPDAPFSRYDSLKGANVLQ